MSPDDLKAYLSVLPPGTFQVELTVGDTSIKLNIAPVAGTGTPAATTVQPGDTVITADDPVGQAFPQLIGKRHKDLGSGGVV